MGKEIHIASGFVAYTIFIIHSLQLIIRAIAKKVCNVVSIDLLFCIFFVAESMLIELDSTVSLIF